MTQLTAKQQVVLEAIQQLGKATAIDIAKVISGGQESADAHLRRLHKLKIIHVCEWGTGAYNHPIKVFAYGEGVDAVIDKKAHFAKIRKVRDALKAKPIKLYVYDKKAPIVPNTGGCLLFTLGTGLSTIMIILSTWLDSNLDQIWQQNGYLIHQGARYE